MHTHRGFNSDLTGVEYKIMNCNRVNISPIANLCTQRNAVSSEMESGSKTACMISDPVIRLSPELLQKWAALPPAGFEKFCSCLEKLLNVSFQEKMWG